MAWANVNNTYDTYDMDSGATTTRQDRRLVVRNTTGAHTPDYRAEVIETSAGAQALKVDGKIRLERGGDYCGTIEPLSGGALNLNADTGDPDVTIGNDSTLSLLGSSVVIGSDESPATEIFVHGASMHLFEPNLTVNNVVSAGQLNSPRVDARGGDASLEVGTVQAPNVTIGRAGHDTQVNGTLHVSEQAHLTGGVAGPFSVDGTVVANGMNLNGSAIVSNTVVAAALDINGNGDVSGDLTVHGANTINGHVIVGTLLQHSNVDVNGNVNVNGDISAGKLSTSGDTSLGAALTIAGKTAMGGNLNMLSHMVYLDSSSQAFIRFANNRVEIGVGGAVHFYIDSTGGHNA